MEFAEFQGLVDALLAEHASKGFPPEIRILDEVRADDADIEAVETQLGARLPEKYKQVLTTYGGGMFGFVDLLPVRSPKDGESDVLTENTGEFAVAGFVQVAPVGSGDMWGFAVHDGVCAEAVSMWFHDTGEIQFESGDFLEFMATRGVRAR
ncbi:SMI1/KNR4 family protein [Actinoplanes sp. NPDC051470]|uniref:SMI1/KNR4 family protein n=1 Tax=Actinoplanes sp. NPDC051470 TaxID=3157224 RepID=UPI0034210395